MVVNKLAERGRSVRSRINKRKVGITSLLVMALQVAFAQSATAQTAAIEGHKAAWFVLQADDGGFCDTEAGQFLQSTTGIVISFAVAVIIMGIFVGMALEAMPVTGRIASVGHSVVGGTLISIIFGIIALGFLQFGLGYSPIDPSTACTPL